MALESNPNQAFLSNDAMEDDLLALDSMAFTGTQSQFGMNTVAFTPSNNGNSSFGSSVHSGVIGGGGGAGGDRIGDGRDGGGFAGVSESLFDRIRARTAEQQKQQQQQSLGSQSSHISAGSSQSQDAAQSSQQQQQSMAFASEQAPGSLFGVTQQQQQQQSSSEPTMELERNASNNFDAAVTDAGSDSPSKQNANTATNNNETTYSFAASAGEDFSRANVNSSPLRVPQYGKSRDDPYYAATSSNQQQQYPTSVQDKASAALAQTGETVKSLFGAGVEGAKALGTMAQNKMAGGGGGGGGERSYNNNFLLREDSLETGGGGGSGGMGNNVMDAATMSQPPPPVSAAVASGAETGPGASDRAYSMLEYGKTFCEDAFGFVMQLPPWGKGIVAVVLLWVIYVVFG